MSQAIDTLTEEHRVIERVLEALEAYVTRIENGAIPDRARVAEFAEFFRDFADTCHHGKEEEILFKTLIELGFPREHGPVGMMLFEHAQGREHVAAIAGVGQGSGPVTEQERQSLIAHTREYVPLLRQHILKEDRVLYPMAAQRVSVEDWNRMAKAFEAFERDVMGEGRHHTLHDLAHRLMAAPGDTPPPPHHH
jgi:hemerythrin-like domain-containing protein